ncbi:hypothetical protein TCAL_15246 [Tigriopus californicus]|uniref:Uncharacterized protein n=1 Tax=Tigriopus californicus TaxID=6832 RepID=A0A553NDY8_TIGCA|nr:hypothetical protein TCAL_15246 [Tigriopus californicus]
MAIVEVTFPTRNNPIITVEFDLSIKPMAMHEIPKEAIPTTIKNFRPSLSTLAMIIRLAELQDHSMPRNPHRTNAHDSQEPKCGVGIIIRNEASNYDTGSYDG